MLGMDCTRVCIYWYVSGIQYPGHIEKERRIWKKNKCPGHHGTGAPVPKPDVDDLIFTGQIGYISDR